MPTYVYKCLECDNQFDVQQSFTDPTLVETACPSCHTIRPVRKVFTPVGVTFKGSGFYKTDSRGSKKSGSSSGSASSNGESGGSSSDTSSGTSSSTTSSSGDSSSSASPAPSSSGSAPASAPSAGTS